MQPLIDGFINFKMLNDGRSDRTAQAYRDILSRFADFLGDADPCNVTEETLLVFTGMHLNKTFNLHARSRVPYVACIRGFYAWLDRMGYLGMNNPAENLPYPKAGKPLPDVIELGNAEKLISAPDLSTFEGVRDAALLAVLLGCGIRLAGLVALNRSSLQTYMVKKQPRMALRVLEKGDKERQIPVPREAELLLRVYLEHPDHELYDTALPDGDAPLWISTTHNRHTPPHENHGERRRLTRRGIQAMIIRYGTKVGIPRNQLHPHAFRHRFGTELTESDIPLNQTGELMGHSSPKSTEIYLHLAMQKKTESMDKGNPLAKIKSPASELLRRLENKGKPGFVGAV